ncbi:L-rhamnose mutarotase [Asanoa iriomotensis]|uniref:L-rhamnose mutarotase n=1 Tax=Asanoa iriomotensis TaxID=234613 RepID=A0ABQ4BZ84_9ACTN|nr:L-rhamnose mutarotase [Asanoa iriomotensis]GIF55822.1 L-rhamnose mutarotase [Asanoa iriomotensis]
MERVAFILNVRPDAVDEYRRRHAAVWPDMRSALAQAGWHNYSLFLRPDGLAVGYLESPDFEGSLRHMDGLAVNERWQAEMAPLVLRPDGRRADESLHRLPEIFHLD